VPDSPLTRGSDATLLTYAGEEIAIAATKSFTSQLAALLLLSIYIAEARGASSKEVAVLQNGLKILPDCMDLVLSVDKKCQELAVKFAGSNNFLVMGRNIDYPIALEGALKLKETSYIQAEGYPTGEIKHGPAALIDEQLPVIVLATHNPNDPGSVMRHEKTVVNIREFTNRGIPVVALITEGEVEIAKHTPYLISIPPVAELLQPMLAVIPLQLIAYYSGVTRGHNVDQPRNLSKSVLVE
jgi:glucosamine--fructose-6-phosphate aminotransferase (isomerizing)